MARYSKEKKEHALSLMSPPHNLTVAEVAGRTGVTEPTLYAWRNQARGEGRAVPGDGSNPENWKPEDKFAVVVETLGMAEAELGEYCRQKGLLEGQIAQWRAACMQANAAGTREAGAGALAQERKRSRELERELHRKERALAEAAALLVLSRKLEAFQSRDEDA